MAQSISQEAIGATGLPGATAASRHAGATTSGAPTTGTFAVGDYVVDQTGAMYVCTVAGTPGTWQVVGTPPTAQIAGKNAIINGDFGVWQRGTSFSIGAGLTGYTADRWFIVNAPPGQTASVTQGTFTPGTAPVAGYESTNYLNVTWSSYTANTFFLSQRVEDVRKFAGQTVTLSFWAKASTANSSMTPLISQNFGSGGSAATYSYNSAISITTSWQRFSTTLTLPSISGATIGTNSFLDVRPFYGSSSTTNGVTFSIWGVQLEAGNLAGATPTTGYPTEFTTASGSIGGELALCQRYYIRTTPGLSYGTYGFGFAQASTTAVVAVNLPVTLRTLPTTLDYSNLALQSGSYSSSVNASGALAFEGSTSSPQLVMIFANYTTGMTANQPARLINNNNTAGYLGIGAEL